MTYDNFLEQVLSIVDVDTPCINNHKRYYCCQFTPKYGPEQLKVKWVTGGISGGSCWEDSDPQPYTIRDVREPEFADLDKVILMFCPNIGFIQYKNLHNQLVIYGEEEDHEYYGNCTYYNTKTVILKELYDYLCSNGFIEGEE